MNLLIFFLNDSPTSKISTLSLHDALPISNPISGWQWYIIELERLETDTVCRVYEVGWDAQRSEEHTSELQSRFDLVCRLLLEKKKSNIILSLQILKGIATYS